MRDSKQLWQQSLQYISMKVPEQQYKSWFEPIKCYSYKDNELTLLVPSQYFFEYLEEHYLGVLCSVLNKVYGTGTKLMYKIEADKTHNITLDYGTSNRSTVVTDEKRPATGMTKPAENTEQQLNPHLNPNYNFENFIEGLSNKLARSVGQSIAEHPKQTTFNPLFIYGASGVGKTHLINAIGTKIKELHPEKRVLYVTAHLFQIQYTDSVRKNTVNDFTKFYQTIDVLIIDDIQEFASQVKTQNTFFHIFNQLHLNGKQLILTSDKPPTALQGMEERLLTRFKWGLITELERPNKELRYDILKNKIKKDGLNIPNNVIDFIAEHISDSVRELEGVINSLMAYSVVWNRDIDLNMAEVILKRAVKNEKKAITVDGILEVCCEYFGVKQEDIFTSSRKQNIVQVRQVAMYLSQKYTNLSTARIGALIGKRNHATVLHSCKQVEDRIQVDKSFKSKIEEIEALLKKRP